VLNLQQSQWSQDISMLYGIEDDEEELADELPIFDLM
jgi:hypothetical protein